MVTVHSETSVYYPRFYDITLARKIASETRKETNKGKLARRTTMGMLWRFVRGRSVIVQNSGESVASASITFRGRFQGKIYEEVGTVVVWGEPGNGFGKDSVAGMIKRRRGKADVFFAMVQEKNNEGLALFDRKLHGEIMKGDEVPPAALKEKVPDAPSQHFVNFNITHVQQY